MTTYKDGQFADRTAQLSTPVTTQEQRAASRQPATDGTVGGGVGPRGIVGAPIITEYLWDNNPGRYVSAADFVPDQVSTVSADEKARFGAPGIRAQNELDEDRGAALGLTPATGPTRNTTLTPSQARFPGGAAAISRADARALLPMTMHRDLESRTDFVVSNYPTLFKAAQASGLADDQVRDVVNLTLAVDAALTIGKTMTQRRQMELLRSMPKYQAALVIDIMNAITEEQKRQSPAIDSQLEVAGLNASVDVAKQALDRAAGVEQNPVLGAVKDWFWNPSVNVSGLAWVYPDTDWGPIQNGELYFGAKGALDTLISANEMAVRTANAAMLAPGNGPVNAWNMTEAGSFDPTMVAEIKKHYDPALVDMMLEFKRLAAQGVPGAEASAILVEKYGENPILDQIAFNTDPDSEISKLANELDVAETSNIANVMGWSMFAWLGGNAANYADIEAKANNSLVRGATAVGNMGLTVALDPTLGLSRAASAYKIARYGVARMAPGDLSKAFATQAVRNHFDSLGKEFEAIRQMDDVGKQGQRMESLASQNRKWYDYNALQEMYRAGVKDADTARKFLEGGENLLLAVSGQAMNLKRSYEWTVPHSTKATVVWKATTLRMRGMNPANMGGSAKFIDAIFGDGTSKMLPEDAMQHITKIIEENPQAAGRLMSDWAYTDDGGVTRTLLGKVIGVKDGEQAMRNRYGWLRKGIMTGDLAYTADRIGRLLARMPQTSRGLAVDSGSDAEMVKQLAQSVGIPRYLANTLKFAWGSMDEPTRIRFVNSFNAAAITASGVDLVAPQFAADLATTFAVASRPGTLYVADQVDVLAIRTLAEKRVDELDKARRAQNLELMTAAQRETAVLDEMGRLADNLPTDRLADAERTLAEYKSVLDEARTNGAKNVDELRSQAGTLVPDETGALKYVPSDAEAKSTMDAAIAEVERRLPKLEDSIAGNGQQRIMPKQWGLGPVDANVFVKEGYVPLGWAKKLVAGKREGVWPEEFWAWLDDGVDDLDYATTRGVPMQQGVSELEMMATTLPSKPNGPARWIEVPWARPLSKAGRQQEADNVASSWMDDLSDMREADSASVTAAADEAQAALDNEISMLEGIIAQQEQLVSQLRDSLAIQRPAGLSGQERKDAFYGAFDREFQRALDEGAIFNPSSLNATDNYALYDSQLTHRVSVIDPQKLSQLMARQSYLNILLGGGPKITKATDLWTLATLAGPRFVMRSGLEDFGLFALTNGQLFGHGGFFESRRAAMAIRESMLRGPSNQKLRGNNPGMKLGLAATARREVGTALSDKVPIMRGLILPYADKDEVAEATAMALAKGPERSRESLALLFGSLFARGQFFSANRLRYALGKDMKLTGEAKEAADVITEGVKRGYLFDNMNRASEVTEHLADGSASALSTGPKPMLSEVVEGTTISYIDAGIEVKNINTGFKTTFELGKRRHDDLEELYGDLGQSLYESGYKSYLAIARSQEYYRLRMAVLKATDNDKLATAQESFNRFLSDFADEIADDPNLPSYVIAKELGVEEYVKRLMDDNLRLLTTRDGKFNYRMLDRLRLPNHRVVRVSEDLADELGLPYTPTKSGMVRVTLRQDEYDKAMKVAFEGDRLVLEAAGRPVRTFDKNGVEIQRKFGLYYVDEDGQFKYNMHVNDLHDEKLPMPQSVRTSDTITVPVTDKIPFTAAAWSSMGRALARLTREPIYLSNYYDAYKGVAPFKQKMIDDLIAGGKPADEAAEMAEDWAHKWAADEAYAMTMAGVDNPAIRSQLAWQVRNIARFYRALEDFNRRMLRVAENKPETFWKLALAWNVLDDSGFVWEDEYGDKYLMFPGTQAAFQAMNDVMAGLGVQPKVPGLPMTWGAKVTMFSPSTDPNAMVPTLGAPMSGAGLKSVLRVMPSLGWISKESSQAIEGALFGEYSPQQTFTAALANDLFGPNLKRVFDAFSATYGGAESRQNMTDTAVAIAGKQAIHAMAAAGIYDPTKDYTDAELAELRAIADTTAVNAIYLKLLLTPNLPATPQAMTTDVSDEARAIGIDSGNALWIKYLNQYPSYDEAFLAFTKDNPGRAIFTVSKYESSAFYESTVQTEAFVRQNMAEFEARPVGLSHFAPVEGDYSGLTGFYFARANNIKVPTTVEDFFNRTVRAAGDAELRWLDQQAEQALADGVDPAKVEKAKSKTKDDILAQYPLAEYQKVFGADRVQDSRREADEIAETARYMVDSGQDADKRAETYLRVYSQYKEAMRVQAETEKGSGERTKVNKAWRSYVEKEALPLFPADDKRWNRFLKVLSGALNVQVEAL